jgi:hypothetical protein
MRSMLQNATPTNKPRHSFTSGVDSAPRVVDGAVKEAMLCNSQQDSQQDPKLKLKRWVHMSKVKQIVSEPAQRWITDC